MMRRRYLPLLALPAVATAQPTELRAADGLLISAEFRAAQARRRGTILLFHQAGSSLAEYSTIAPELARRGFDTLATDQRSGGENWGRRNATAARLGANPGFMAALQDLQAALAWARQRDPSGRVLVWGSSYSASLVFLLAASPAVSAVLAFSPGEYLRGTSVRAAAAQVRCPVFVTSSSTANEEAAAEAILAATQGAPKRQFRARPGQHGSSTLRADSNPGGAAGAAAVWVAVNAFLDEVAA